MSGVFVRTELLTNDKYFQYVDYIVNKTNSIVTMTTAIKGAN